MSCFLFLFCFWFCFILGGGNRSVRSFSPSHPFTGPLLPEAAFGSVSCFCAVWFWFLGLSCSVVVLQTHCDLKASVPVPTTIWEGGRGPTAGMLGQKVTAWAQGCSGEGVDVGRVGGQAWAGVWGGQPNLPELAGQPPFTQTWRLSPEAAVSDGDLSRHVLILTPQREATSHPPRHSKHS